MSEFDGENLTESEKEIFNGHAWALSTLAAKIGPMTDQYDGYSADSDLATLKEIMKHAEWLNDRLNPEDGFCGERK